MNPGPTSESEQKAPRMRRGRPRAPRETESDFCRRTDALAATTGLNLGEISRRLGISRSTFHYMRAGRWAPNQEVADRLAHMEAHQGEPPPEAAPSTDTLDLLVRLPGAGLKAGQKGKSVTVPLSYRSAEPNLPTEVDLQLGLSRIEDAIPFISAIVNGEHRNIVLSALPEPLATNDFVEKLTPTAFLALLEGTLLLIFGHAWRTEVKKLILPTNNDQPA